MKRKIANPKTENPTKREVKMKRKIANPKTENPTKRGIKKKREIEYEVHFKTKGKSIILKEYVEPKETLLSWNKGKEKKIFKGKEGMWRADNFVKFHWPDRRVVWTSLKPLTPAEIHAWEKRAGLLDRQGRSKL